MKVPSLPANAKHLFDNLYITIEGDAYHFIPAGSPFRNTTRKKDSITKYTQFIHKAGYYTIKHQGKEYKIHRLIAMAFIPNPNNKPYVNHIDSNRQNNHPSNLEWVTPSENLTHAYRSGKRRTARVKQFTKDKVFIKEHNSITEASEAVGVSRVAISMLCRKVGRSKTSAGFIWEYA